MCRSLWLRKAYYEVTASIMQGEDIESRLLHFWTVPRVPFLEPFASVGLRVSGSYQPGLHAISGPNLASFSSRNCMLFVAHIPAIWIYAICQIAAGMQQPQQKIQENQQPAKALFICDSHLHLAPQSISSQSSQPKHFSHPPTPVAS